jgi:hypothetical protein
MQDARDHSRDVTQPLPSAVAAGELPRRGSARIVRKLIVIALDQYVRNMVIAGAFADIEDENTYYMSSALEDASELEGRPRYLGTIDPTTERRRSYMRLRRLLLASYRFRSRTQRIKLRFRPPVQRGLIKLVSLPGLRQLAVRRLMRELGLLPELHRLLEDLRPDIVIAPTGGTDPLVLDAIRSSRALGITTLVIPFNWDNLSSKTAYPVAPDYLGVVGPQSVEHAQRIHGIPAERVSLLGAPYIDAYFHREAEATESPFPFRYVLFAGCSLPFDERTSLELLERTIEGAGLDLKVVYRPHPQRRRRRVPDRIDEARFSHVVIDPQVRDQYLRSFEPDGERSLPPMPALEYYPALLEHAEFVICPLSTMVLESAIFEREVIVIAYHDGIHKDSPGVVVGYDHFQGMDRIDGLHMCRRVDDLAPLFRSLAAEPRRAQARSMRAQVHPWIYHDERPYRERLAELVQAIALREGIIDEREALTAQKS